MSVILGGGGIVVSTNKGVGAGVGASGGVPGLFTGSGFPTTAPPYIGALYFDTTNGSFYVSQGSLQPSDWNEIVGVLHRFRIAYYEEFVFYTSGAGLFADHNTGSGTNTIITGLGGGMLQMQTGNAAGNENCISFTAGNIAVLNKANKRVMFIVQPSTATSTICFVGESNQTDSLAAGANSLGFELNSSNAQPTHWYITQVNNGTITRTDTGTVADLAATHRYEMQWDSTGANCIFYIDGVSQGTLGTLASNVSPQIRLRTVTGGVQTLIVGAFTAVVAR